MASMNQPRTREQAVPILQEEQIAKLFQVCRGQEFDARRHLANLRVMTTRGGPARRARRPSLRPNDPERSDVDLDTGQVRVLWKGRRDRLAPLDPRTVKSLDRCLRLCAWPPYAESLSLWLGRRGRFAVDGIRQMLERRARQAGLGHVTPHQLCHSFAQAWLADGG